MFILNCYIAKEIALLESYGLFWNVLYGPLNISVQLVVLYWKAVEHINRI